VEHSEITEAGNVLQFVTPKELLLSMKAVDLAEAVRRVSGRMFQIKVTPGEVQVEPVAPARQQDEVSQRALENPEVQKYRELFGGEVRAVRDLKG